jgi:glutamine synthetase
MSFVARHGIGTNERDRGVADVAAKIAAETLEVVRFSFVDQHGILRGKTLVASEAIKALDDGCALTTTLIAKDTAHRTAFSVFDPSRNPDGRLPLAGMEGAADMVMIADPATFKVLPWAPRSGWVLCDLYFPTGAPVPFSTRGILRETHARLNRAGYDFVAGLEVEFHIFKLDDPKLGVADSGQPGTPPDVSLLTHGYQYLTEQRYDAMEPILDILRRDILALGLPLRTLEVEFGPSQVEFTFAPGVGLASADRMVLFRGAVKQIARRHGYHATFMCRPRLPNVQSSGWHLHQSLIDRATGQNAFTGAGGPTAAAAMSPVAWHYLAGLLDNARAATIFAAPTLNGYKRYRPYSLAPDRAIWARDNRGAMLRVISRPGDPATRIENRVGEPAANPYLYLASQIIAGLDGIERRLEPPPSADAPYETKAAPLPGSLAEAAAALRDSACFRAGLGDAFVDYYLHIKEAEIARFESEVSDWEHREYFEMF